MARWNRNAENSAYDVSKFRSCGSAGFTLTEMLVTVLILTLVSTLMMTGIPVAIDTYKKLVKTSNAQLAISTTIEVMRNELGLATEVRVVNGTIYYYNTGSGYWYSIGNPKEDLDTTPRGLVRQIYRGTDTTVVDVTELVPFNTKAEPLLSDAAITEEVLIRLDEEILQDPTEVGIVLKAIDKPRLEIAGEEHVLASVGEKGNEYRILTRFVS